MIDLVTPTDRWSRDFVQQVVGAACCEETLKFLAVGGLLWWSRERTSVSLPIAIATSVGIGFMTLENLIAIAKAESALQMAMDRQVTILAGHPSYQVIMGYCLSRWRATEKSWWLAASLLLPILLHGWGDFSDAVFQDEPIPGSREDTVVFQAWIMSIVATAMITIACLTVSHRE